MADIYLLLEGKQEGPYTEQQVRESLVGGHIPVDQLAWREGLTEWVAVSGVLSETQGPANEVQTESQAPLDVQPIQEPFDSHPILSPKINEKQVRIIESNLQVKNTDELLAIWHAENRDEYSDEGFEAVRRILGSRGHAFSPKIYPTIPSNEKLRNQIAPSPITAKEWVIVIIRRVARFMGLFFAVIGFFGVFSGSSGRYPEMWPVFLYILVVGCATVFGLKSKRLWFRIPVGLLNIPLVLIGLNYILFIPVGSVVKIRLMYGAICLIGGGASVVALLVPRFAPMAVLHSEKKGSGIGT